MASKKITKQRIEEIKGLAGEANRLLRSLNFETAKDEFDFAGATEQALIDKCDPQTILALIEWGEAWREAALILEIDEGCEVCVGTSSPENPCAFCEALDRARAIEGDGCVHANWWALDSGQRWCGDCNKSIEIEAGA